MNRIRSLVSIAAPVVAVAIFVGAIWLLFHELKQSHMRDIRQAVSQIPSWRLCAALGLTVLNDCILFGYD